MKQELSKKAAIYFLFFGLQTFAQTNLQTGNFVDNRGPCGTLVPDQEWESRFQELIKQARIEQGEKKASMVPYTIPVIIHVIHGGQAVGTYPNLAQGQLNSQIQVLNNDFGGIGYNSGNYPPTAFDLWAASQGLPSPNLDGMGRVKIADCNVQFCLATKDTLGNVLAEPGIERINYVSKGWSNPGSFTSSSALQSFINGTVKPQTIWNVTKYLNIWVTDNNINANSLLGYATFPPYSGLSGISASFVGSATTDGFWCYARVFGSKTIFPSGSYFAGYERGRTSTHEIGHWLGLRHIGGDGSSNPSGDCNATDYCDDTPPQKGGYGSGAFGQNFGAPSYPLFATGNSSCPTSLDGCMFMNFMDYTDDNSKYMYTTDQATRIQAAMANSPYRKFLGTHNLCSVIPMASVSQFKVPASVCQYAVMTLTNTSVGTPAPSYTWSSTGTPNFFPDANSAATVIFDTPGTYVITLTTDNGTVSVSSKTVIVHPSPNLSLSVQSGNMCIDEPFDIEASGGTSYFWLPDSVASTGITYYASGDQTFTCIATNQDGCISTTEVAFTVVNCTGIKDVFTNENRFTMYPNPSQGLLYLKSKLREEVHVSVAVSDVSGKQILRQDLNFSPDANELFVNMETLSKGLYILKLSTDKGDDLFIKVVKE